MTAPTQPVTVRVADFGGDSLAGVLVTARMDNVDYTADGTFVANTPVTGTTDVNGEAVLECFPNGLAPSGLGTRGTVTRFTAQLSNSRALDVLAIIPDSPCNLVNILVNENPTPLSDAEIAVQQAQIAAASSSSSASASAASAGAAAASAAAAATSATGAAGSATAAAGSASAAAASATAAGGSATAAAGSATAAAGSATAASTSATAAAASASAASTAQTATETARDQALSANKIFASTAKAVSKGVSTYASLVAGSGGTNGTFDLAFSGGGGSGAAGRFVVAGGALTAITITATGDSYTSAPIISFAASTGLTGASATAVIANNTDDGEYFYVPSTDTGESLILYKNISGAASEVKRYTVGALAVSTRAGFTALATPASPTLPRAVEIAADVLHGSRPTMNVFDGQTLRFVHDLDPTPATVFGTSNNAGIFNIQDIGTMFQDDYCQSPVTAAGQSVAVVRDIRGMDLGAELVTIAGFGTAAGWSKTATTLTAAASSSDLTHAGVGGVIGGKYWIEFDLAVTSGSVYAAIGLSTGPVFTTSGRKRFYLDHESNTTAGFYFHPAAFTGSITNITVKKDSRNHLIRDGVRPLPLYQVNASGVAYLDTSGANLTNAYAVTSTIPLHMGVAIERTAAESKLMCGVYDGSGNGASVTNTTTAEATVNSQVAGVVVQVYSRAASFPIGRPVVFDMLIKAGTSSSWVNGGERDAIAGTNGASRTSVNAFAGGAALNGLKVQLNNNAASSHRIYGFAFYFGDPGTQGRRDISKWLRRVSGLAFLDSLGYDAFLIAGQSNAMGVGNYATSTTPTLGQGAEFLDCGCLKALIDPTQHNMRGGANVSLSGSAWPSFANTYYSLTGRRACIIGSAFSGVGLINDGAGPAGGWQPSGPLVSDAANKADACLSYFQKVHSFSRLRGVIWAGGEQDSNSAFTVASYKAALVSLRDRFRLATGVYNLPLYIISLDKSPTPAIEAQWALIRQAQSEAAAENDGIKLVVPYGDYYDAGMTDGVHYNQTGLNTIGALAATNVAALIA
jgi:hypothetical protein